MQVTSSYDAYPTNRADESSTAMRAAAAKAARVSRLHEHRATALAELDARGAALRSRLAAAQPASAEGSSVADDGQNTREELQRVLGTWCVERAAAVDHWARLLALPENTLTQAERIDANGLHALAVERARQQRRAQEEDEAARAGVVRSRAYFAQLRAARQHAGTLNLSPISQRPAEMAEEISALKASDEARQRRVTVMRQTMRHQKAPPLRLSRVVAFGDGSLVNPCPRAATSDEPPPLSSLCARATAANVAAMVEALNKKAIALLGGLLHRHALRHLEAALALTSDDSADLWLPSSKGEGGERCTGSRQQQLARAATHLNMSLLHRHAGNVPEALAEMEACVAIEERLGAASCTTALNLCGLLLAAGHRQPALLAARRALKLAPNGDTCDRETEHLRALCLHSVAECEAAVRGERRGTGAVRAVGAIAAARLGASDPIAVELQRRARCVNGERSAAPEPRVSHRCSSAAISPALPSLIGGRALSITWEAPAPPPPPASAAGAPRCATAPL